MPWNSLSRLSDRKDLRRPGACRKPRPVRPRLEPLEERLTPSGNGIVEYTIPPAYYGPFGLVTASGNLYFTKQGPTNVQDRQGHHRRHRYRIRRQPLRGPLLHRPTAPAATFGTRRPMPGRAVPGTTSA